MGTNVEESMRVRESPEQSYKGLWGNSVSSLGNTEVVYLPGSVNFQSTGSALPFPLSLSGHEFLMEMNGIFTLLLSLTSISLSLDVFSELAPQCWSWVKGMCFF